MYPHDNKILRSSIIDTHILIGDWFIKKIIYMYFINIKETTC